MIFTKNNSFLHKKQISLVIFFIVILLIIFNTASWFLYYKVKKHQDIELGKRLEFIATSIALRIENDYLKDIFTSSKLLNFLQEIEKNNNLDEIFIFNEKNYILINENNILNVDAPYPYLLWHSNSITKAWEGKSSFSNLYEIENEFFKNAFAPIKNEQGKVEKIVCVEASSEFLRVLNTFKKGLISVIIWSILIIICLGILLNRLFSSIMKTQKVIEKAERISNLGNLSAIVAHEIRNPLFIIEATGDLIKRKYGTNEDELFNYIPEEVERLNKIINDFLDFSKETPLNKRKKSLNKILDEIIKKRKEKIQQIEINFYPDLQIKECFFDPDKIKQIFINLFQNAIQSVTTTNEKKIEIKTELIFQRKNFKTKKIKIEIKDTGIGIAKKDQKKIFEPFFTTKAKGTGLGLYIAQKIIKQHNGEIKINCIKNQGTTIQILIPYI
ncbi:MAG: ATP-binding protein, partial [bacterium]